MGWIRKVLGELLWPTLIRVVLCLWCCYLKPQLAWVLQPWHSSACSAVQVCIHGQERNLVCWGGTCQVCGSTRKKTDRCQVKIHICRDFPYAHCSNCITCCNVTFLFGKVLCCHAGGDLAPWNF